MVKVPFNDLQRHHASLRTEFHRILDVTLDTSRFIKGKPVEEFEAAFAAFCGARFCRGTSNGTSAIHLALLAVGVRAGDEVILPANTFIATAEAIVSAGAVPVFCDVDKDTYLLTAATVRDVITPKTKAIIAVHLYGQMCDMDALGALAKERKLFLIEDAAQAHGATWNGHPPGHYSAIATFSFYPGKNLGALGDAGCVVTNDPTLAEAVEMLADHGRKRGEKYDHAIVGTNERMDSLQACFLSAKLPFLSGWVEKKRKIASAYTTALQGIVKTPAVSPHAQHAYHLYVIETTRRTQLMEHLKAHGVECGIHYPIPLHKLEAFKKMKPAVPLSNAETAAGHILSLPLFPEMMQSEIDAVIAAVRSFR